MDYLKGISKLLDVAEEFGVPQAHLGKIFIDLAVAVKEQSGLTDEQLVERTALTLDENERALLARKIFLESLQKTHPPT